MPVEMAFYFCSSPLMVLMGAILRLLHGWRHRALVATWGVHSYAPYFVFGAIWSALLFGFDGLLEKIPA
jgi:hypothetical protein